MKNIVISGTGLHVPSDVVTNEELVSAFNAYVQRYNAENADKIASGECAALMESSAEFIVKASGIKRRHVIGKSGILDPERMRPRVRARNNDEHSIQCEAALGAAREALRTAGRSAEEIDLVIVACSNMQRAYPAMSIELQAALGSRGFAFDMNVACSSATFGLDTARSAILAGTAKRVLVVNPEFTSCHLNFRDRDSHFIFGDACTAAVLEAEDETRSQSAFRIMGTRLETRFSNNIRNNLGFLNRNEDSHIVEGPKTDKLFVQEGRKVFKEVVPMVAEIISAHLEDLEIEASEVKKLWLHQANLAMNQLISARVLGRDATPEEMPTVLDEYANTSSAGSLIAFHLYSSDFMPKEIGVICSFGAGYSVGSVIVQKV